MKGTAAFQFYPKDFLTDRNVLAMDMLERGIYITLLCVSWIEQGIPTDLDELARIVNMPRNVFELCWSRVGVCWRTSPEHPEIYVNPRQEKDRLAYANYSNKKAAAGRASGVSRRKASKSNKRRTQSEQGTSKKRTKANPPTPTPSTDQQNHPSDSSPGTAVRTDSRMDGKAGCGVGTRDRRAEIGRLTKKAASRRKP